jgi:type I restriction-modification system DNA methylase subunit
METVIDKIRNILRKEGITGMDSINHCIVFIIARMLDSEKCKKYDISLCNSYYNIMHDNDGDLIGAQDLYSRIYNKKNNNCLVFEIAIKLKFSNIKFKLESPQHLLQIMKELENLDINKLENKYDIIGTIYEYHLKSGTSNSMRDLGQYYTNRQVINFMINLCKPTINKSGEIETIIDPTMGTGGFLTMSVKYLNDKYKNINWALNKNRIYGFDIDENVKNMAILNMLLESGELCEKTFIKNDTLYNDFKMPNDDILEKVDIILANEPMGIKNIIHASCCDRIKELKIRGTKAEPLFLQLFMQSLNDGGRCAVIIPDGVLFNDSNLHSDTRKHLVENFNLKKVISLNDDFFLNTGVKTSILFFVKDGKTSNVEFSEIKLNKNELIETSIIRVDYKKIVELDYSLFGNKYNVKEVKKIEGIKYVKLGDISTFLSKSKRQASYGKDEGQYPFYTSGITVKRCDECDYNEECIIIGTGGNANIKISNSFSCSADNFIIKINKDIITKYIYYYLLININILENGFCGSTIKHISKDYVQKIEIPVPSIEVQQKIVEQLDVIYSNIKTCKEQIEESKKIMKYYIESMTYCEEEQKLGDICDINRDNIKSSYKYINYIDISSVNEGSIINITKMTSNFPSRAKRIFKKEDILLSTIRPNLRNYVYIQNEIDNGICSTGFAVITSKSSIINKYIYYQLMSDNITEYLINNAVGSQYPAVNIDTINNIKIPIPSLEKQKEIVSYCDEFDKTIKSTELRIKLNETLMKNIMNVYLFTNNKNIDIQEQEQEVNNDNLDDNIQDENNDEQLKSISKKIKKEIKSKSSNKNNDNDDNDDVQKPVIKKKLIKKVKNKD